MGSIPIPTSKPPLLKRNLSPPPLPLCFLLPATARLKTHHRAHSRRSLYPIRCTAPASTFLPSAARHHRRPASGALYLAHRCHPPALWHLHACPSAAQFSHLPAVDFLARQCLYPASTCHASTWDASPRTLPTITLLTVPEPAPHSIH